MVVIYHLRQRFQQITFLFHLARDYLAASTTNVWIPFACSTRECMLVRRDYLRTLYIYMRARTSLLAACLAACPYLLVNFTRIMYRIIIIKIDMITPVSPLYLYTLLQCRS